MSDIIKWKPLDANPKVHNSYCTYLMDDKKKVLIEKKPALYAITPYQAHASTKDADPIFAFKAGLAEQLGKRFGNYETGYPYSFYILAVVECPKTKLKDFEKRMWKLLLDNGCKRLITPVRTSRQLDKGEWFIGSVPQIHKTFDTLKIEIEVSMKKKKSLVFYNNEDLFPIRPHLAEGFFGKYTPKGLIIK